MTVIYGADTPRIAYIPPSIASEADRVVKFAKWVGVDLYPWQAAVIAGLFAVGEDGLWAAKEFGLLVSRQNGKGEILVVYVLAHLFLFRNHGPRGKTIIYTAHRFGTALDGFARIQAVLRGKPALMRKVAKILESNGKEGIVMKLRSGQKTPDSVRFVARSKNTARGLSGDVLVFDEAQELGNAAYTSITYTQTTVLNRQEVFFGTVPDPEVNEFDVFEDVRDRGRAGDSPHTAWFEFSPEGADDHDAAALIDQSAHTVWAQAAPSLGYLIPIANVEKEFLSSRKNPAAFARERLSIWPNRVDEAVRAPNDVNLVTWAEGRAERPTTTVPVFAATLSQDNTYATISSAMRSDDGTKIFVETRRTERGILWVAEALAELMKAEESKLLVVDGKNSAAIMTDLIRLKLPMMQLNLTELCGAHELMIQSINAGLVQHRVGLTQADEQEDLDASLRFATPRPVGSTGYTWGPSLDIEPVTPIQSATHAHWGVKKLESKPPKVITPARGIR